MLSDLDILKLCIICEIDFEPSAVVFNKEDIRIKFEKLTDSSLVLDSEYNVSMHWKNSNGRTIILHFNEETQRMVWDFIADKFAGRS